jgi:hypothetical protein
VTNARGNHKGLQRPYRDEFAVEFELGIFAAFEDHVGFGESAVVVPGCVFTNVGDMQSARKFGNAGECPPGRATRTGNSGNLSEVGGPPATCRESRGGRIGSSRRNFDSGSIRHFMGSVQ